jgi:hypothetical protein
MFKGDKQMRFLREIPADRIKQKELNDLEQNGITIVWKEDSIELWAEC